MRSCACMSAQISPDMPGGVIWLTTVVVKGLPTQNMWLCVCVHTTVGSLLQWSRNWCAMVCACWHGCTHPGVMPLSLPQPLPAADWCNRCRPGLPPSPSSSTRPQQVAGSDSLSSSGIRQDRRGQCAQVRLRTRTAPAHAPCDRACHTATCLQGHVCDHRALSRASRGGPGVRRGHAGAPAVSVHSLGGRGGVQIPGGSCCGPSGAACSDVHPRIARHASVVVLPGVPGH